LWAGNSMDLLLIELKSQFVEQKWVLHGGKESHSAFSPRWKVTGNNGESWRKLITNE
jgi:hypothetical protein